jgi:hypothetical protein
MTREITEAEQRDLQQSGFQGEIQQRTDPVGAPMLVASHGRVRIFGRQGSDVFTDLDSMMARLGDEGWELVGYAQIGSVANMYFKRPFEEAPAPPTEASEDARRS